MHYCYILYDELSNKTYVGYTNNPERRIRQHNGLIKGGAKYTTRQHKSEWKYLAIIASPDFTHQTALSFEWYVKHKSSGVNGRIKSLINSIATNNKFQNYSFALFVSSLMYQSIQNIPYIAFLFDKLLLSNSLCMFYNDYEDFLDDIDFE